jgi:hypothetical protein
MVSRLRKKQDVADFELIFAKMADFFRRLGLYRKTFTIASFDAQ